MAAMIPPRWHPHPIYRLQQEQSMLCVPCHTYSKAGQACFKRLEIKREREREEEKPWFLISCSSELNEMECVKATVRSGVSVTNKPFTVICSTIRCLQVSFSECWVVSNVIYLSVSQWSWLSSNSIRMLKFIKWIPKRDIVSFFCEYICP
jgi:hypothetical protein